jgi:hypothetical protein
VQAQDTIAGALPEGSSRIRINLRLMIHSREMAFCALILGVASPGGMSTRIIENNLAAMSVSARGRRRAIVRRIKGIVSERTNLQVMNVTRGRSIPVMETAEVTEIPLCDKSRNWDPATSVQLNAQTDRILQYRDERAVSPSFLSRSVARNKPLTSL